MHHFTPISALIGGALIGLSAVLFLWLNGRIAGVSGIFHGLIPPRQNDFLWRILFILGLFLGSSVYYIIPTIHFNFRSHYPIGLLISAGLLVGIGTRLGSGCTSGHGVCGVSRLSPRSITATILFVFFGMLAVFILRHIFGIKQ